MIERARHREGVGRFVRENTMLSRIQPLQTSAFSVRDLARYRSLFVGRTSDFTLQRQDGRYYRVGQPLTDQVLTAHLMGEITVGTYVMNEQGRCSFAVFDDDQPDGLKRLARVQMALAYDGYPSYLETSRRGGHLRIFFDQPVPASQVRAWFLSYCPHETEFYPKQDEGGGYGSVIRLPLGIHRLSGKRYPFGVWDGETFVSQPQRGLAGQFAFLDQVERIPVPAHRLVPFTSTGTPTHTHQLLAFSSLDTSPTNSRSIHAWCEAQDPFAVIGNSVQLDLRGIGCCPFGEHHSHGKDRHPSLRVYTPRKMGGSCWYCYTWRQGGNVFDFLCRWYRVDARTMWTRIQRGEL
jgi:hypothetical protein